MKILALLENRKAALILTLLLAFSLLAHHVVNSRPPIAVAGLSAPILYLVPKDPGTIEEKVRPEAFWATEGPAIDVVSEWKSAREALQEGNAEALIIHHAALPLVDSAKLSDLFHNGTTVTGIGIPGLELAEVLGKPTLFTETWSSEEGYRTRLYFYTYSLSLEGTATDIARWESDPDKFNQAVDGIENPLSISSRATTESLVENDVDLLVRVIESHIRRE